ncbi:twin-argninine leader-binding protein DmsD [Actinomyces bovis]|uniref:Twin-argninine leader-binding protein DmsD n=1 Tax=Actinomyces bovis TaxID=1658 RepID=A0ABY1VP37_9ACTO|nr:molecular chaperone TorD family protein [Actinomyces bovis]SPT53512.1 twin-argninine leader-binding protein DmsD [Actinomyces bovis]VEG55435.1 twin-argninine leader-binding protein DmsD [Actinomyces israelii]
MTTDDQLERFAAALSTLGRLQLTPADDQSRTDVVELAPQWPLTACLEADSAAAEYSTAGWAELQASVTSGEAGSVVHADQDRVYGISASAVVPPFESVHRDEEGLVFDRRTLEVRQAYRRLGLHAPKLNREPDDHLGLELDFLAQCCERALDCADRGDARLREEYLSLARDFSSVHLLAWAPAILQQAAQAAQTHWLRGLELLTLGSVLAWGQALGLPSPVQNEQGEYQVIRGQQEF